MIKPSLEELLDKVESKFSLVTIVSKRARQLNSGFVKMVKSQTTKNVSIALEEIAAGKIISIKKKSKEG